MNQATKMHRVTIEEIENGVVVKATARTSKRGMSEAVMSVIERHQLKDLIVTAAIDHLAELAEAKESGLNIDDEFADALAELLAKDVYPPSWSGCKFASDEWFEAKKASKRA